MMLDSTCLASDIIFIVAFLRHFALINAMEKLREQVFTCLHGINYFY